ncbi:MAG: peptidoglycan-N-acetylglucosamine deacetylase, partial [Chloroflexota bacterium]
LRWYRPGWGFYNRRMVNGATDLGYKTVLGSVYPYDANLPNQVAGVDFILRYVMDNVHPGAIVVLHDGLDERARLVDVLQKLLPALEAQGYQFKTLTELETFCSQ